ncbi:trypsin-like peptidase domain-containing protein [Nocardioides sp. BP30]|uniref:S1C family serine protease n=1 Tax=Nocardioides sp. BP30 TaxID=3036374 RepID=UPI0024684353|nr:trypsin-like peptidase domain-containing protein [Nocardioides sp. BP30]WGL52568.1 trypsin-like peptidase domain-containing protein [Nocardioides sp. BP30]
MARRPRSGPVVLAVVALLGGVVGGGVVALIGWWSGWATHESSSTASCSVAPVAERTLPSVVTISAHTSTGSGTGSGVVTRLSGVAGTVIVTNEHVVFPGGATTGAAPQLTLTYADGSTASATLLGADQLTDLAVLRPAADAPKAPAIPIGSSADLRVGDPVIALGAPLGLSSTVTSGIVSATDRYVRVPSDTGAAAHLIDAVQTDAAINPGNSGGALTDCSGRLVGINSAGASPGGESGSSGLGFAIPVDFAVPTARELAANGSVDRPVLGLQVQTVRSSLTDPAAETRLMIEQVEPGGAAQRGGLEAGDVILSVDGSPVHSSDDLVQAQLKATVGDRLKVTVLRDGKQVSTTLTMS